MKNNKKPQDKAIQAVKAYRETGEKTDVLGSYTGIFHYDERPERKYTDGKIYLTDNAVDVPVQDADDL